MALSVVSINDFPENVLAHILSILPMKDAVRTSVLSKEWEYRWTLVYNIQIVDDDLMIVEPTQKNTLTFINFVDRILLYSPDIRHFQLSCGHIRDPCRLKIWISSLSTRNVQSIQIVSPHCGGFTLPPCLLDMPSLIVLELHLPCIIKVPPRDYLRNLRSLMLHSVQFQNECVSSTGLLQLMLPVLEMLFLESCTWGDVKLVEISSPALTIFRCISQAKDVADDFLIKICGAMLEKIYIDGLPLNHFDPSASSVSSVVDALISNEGQRQVLHPFIGASRSHSRASITKMSGLKSLRVFGHIYSTYAPIIPGLPFPRFGQLQKLELTLLIIPEAFLELLHMAPILKQLIVGCSFMRKQEDLTLGEVESVPSCMLSHLAEIDFSYFVGAAHDLDMAKFLLKNSAKLEKVAICVQPESQMQEADIRRWLSTYLKGSPYFSLVFTEEED